MEGVRLEQLESLAPRVGWRVEEADELEQPIERADLSKGRVLDGALPVKLQTARGMAVSEADQPEKREKVCSEIIVANAARGGRTSARGRT